MPRIPRNYLKSKFFHVMTQGINKSFIFEKHEDILYYIKLLYNTEFDVKIIAYCIMNNHAHILINVNNSELLGKYMHQVNTKYAIYYNKKYNRVGYVFRNRYKSEVIRDEGHLYNCIYYIYNNPVKANICQKANQYAYSNYKEFSQKIDIQESEYNFIDIDTKEEKCKELIRVFLVKNNIKKEEFLRNREKLKELVIILREKNGISFRLIEKELDISREKLRKIIM